MTKALRGMTAGASALLLFLLLSATAGAEAGSGSVAAPEPTATPLPACHYMPPDDGQPFQVATTTAKTIKLSQADTIVNTSDYENGAAKSGGADNADWHSYAWAWGAILFVAVGVTGRAWYRGRRGLR